MGTSSTCAASPGVPDCSDSAFWSKKAQLGSAHGIPNRAAAWLGGDVEGGGWRRRVGQEEVL